ncbi:sensor histidine kinase [uncultured Clostridium sp.]|uniref:sensor histidine kinase n=1 Tax=uncultured Clostridium sp. TaxID=59620 RepID=UPI0026033B1C|nr:sensor histidine kinase [uncultured Clostridium sp.]
MSFLRYLKDKSLVLIANIVLFIICVFFLKLLNIGSSIILSLFIIWFLPLMSYIILEYVKINNFFKEIKNTTEEIEEKYLVYEIIKKPSFIEGQIIYDNLRETNKEMHEKVKAYRLKMEEYREYIDMWVHEIKTPIAASKLIIENNSMNELKQIDRELKKIDKMIEQVLYYSKIDEANEDYRIVEIELNEIVGKALKNNSMDFILKRIRVSIENLELDVFCDKKWIEFILNQILTNALKYTGENGEIGIKAVENENNIELKIKDNGVGIPKEDLSKVFLKGYTGENGRKFGKSTGMGLYICKKLCDKLNIGIYINSDEMGTEVTLVFSRGKNTDIFK